MEEDLTCQICSSRPAKIVYLRRRREDVHRTFVCLHCADERAKLHSNAALDFERMLSDMAKGSETGPSSAYSCRLCGATLADIVADGRPGCCLCYSRFAGEIEQAVEAAQGRTRHVGKAPAR